MSRSSMVVMGYPQVAAKRRQSTTFVSFSSVRTDGLPKKAIANAYVHVMTVNNYEDE